jgi:hypothetical protein
MARKAPRDARLLMEPAVLPASAADVCLRYPPDTGHLEERGARGGQSSWTISADVATLLAWGASMNRRHHEQTGDLGEVIAVRHGAIIAPGRTRGAAAMEPCPEIP